MRAVAVSAAAWQSSSSAPVHSAAAPPAITGLRDHLATKAPYVHRVRVPGAPSLYDLPHPSGHKPVFVWALTRHGSRWPTVKRMRQINALQALFQDLSTRVQDPQHAAWMAAWASPVAHSGYLAGELHSTGDEEMTGLAQRLRMHLPELFEGPYAPRHFPIISTQIARAAQSSSAFALGAFGRWVDTKQPFQQQQQPPAAAGAPPADSSSSSSSTTVHQHQQLGHTRSWVPQPVAVSMLPRQQDPVLRFFEACPAYREHESVARRWLAPWQHQQIQQHILPALSRRLGLPPGVLSACHVEALWQLCSFEAIQAAASTAAPAAPGGSSSASSSSPACSLLTQADAQLLEWLDDVRLYETQGYGAPVNYETARPLLADLATSLQAAAAAHARGKAPQHRQRARLMFAHCETLTPLASLMGLFRPHTAAAAGAGAGSGTATRAAASSSSSAHLQPGQDAARQQQRQQIRAAATALEAAGNPGHVLTEVEDEVLQDTPLLQAAEADAAAAAAGQHADEQQEPKRARRSLAKQHHRHGPEADGCSSSEGVALAGVGEWLLPPAGWQPAFAANDAARPWRGGRVAPLGANMLLLLYARSDGDPASSSSSSSSPEASMLVRLVFNEQVIPVPGCSAAGALECSLPEFLRAVGNMAGSTRGHDGRSSSWHRWCFGGAGDSDSSSSSASEVVGGAGAAAAGLSSAGAPARRVVTADGLDLDLDVAFGLSGGDEDGDSSSSSSFGGGPITVA